LMLFVIFLTASMALVSPASILFYFMYMYLISAKYLSHTDVYLGSIIYSAKFRLFVFRKGERRRKVHGKGLWTRAQMQPLQLHNWRQLGKGRESKNR
jgi:hypothetical protein